jgi:hypothetical protein
MATDDTRTSASDAYEIIKARPTLPDTLEVDGKSYDFRTDPLAGGGMMRVKDRGLAFAIRDKYGKGRAPDVTVTRVKYPDAHDRGHRYFFTVPEMPWKKARTEMGQEARPEDQTQEEEQA